MSDTTQKIPTGSIVALVTPFMDHGRTLDLEAWDALLDWHLAAGTDGVVVAGSTGESVALTPPERDRLLAAAVQRCKGRVRVIAGTGAPSTAQAVAQSRRAAELGADLLLVTTPWYNRPPQRGLEAHFTAVADATELPVVLYNVPSRTGVDLLPETALRLARHPRIVAIKEAVPDMDRVRRLVSGGLPVLSGDDPTALEAMGHGASGVISVAANVCPGRFSRMCRFALQGRMDQARELDAVLRGLYAFLGVESNPIPAKWLLASMGRIRNELRLPLVPLDEAHHAAGTALLASIAAPDAPH